MSVSSPFIRRPIATSLLAVGILIAGMFAYRLLPVSSLPEVNFPTIVVTTPFPGASADTMSTLVTAPLERQLGQIPSLDTMTSTSASGVSQITLQFALGRDIDAAAEDVQAAINAAASSLPKSMPYPPTYSKVNPADTPIVTLALTSKTLPITTLSDVADTLLAQRLSQLTGVGHVSVEGGMKPAVRIQADIGRLAAYGLGLESLRTAISNANVATPKGSLNGSSQAYTIGANDQIPSSEGYLNLVVGQNGTTPVLLRDVAHVVDGLENAEVAASYDGTPAVIIDVQRQPGANIVQTVAGVMAALPQLKSALPAGITVSLVSDRTTTIRASVHDVQVTLLISVALVVMVVLLFLRTGRATLIAGTALPLSLIGTFGVMWFCGFSLDNLSLMALTIGTGFVVDDAIVMIENIVRHIEEGRRPLDAAFLGAREIGFTVVSLTVSLVAVFIPLLFMGGLVGRLFREFALTLTIAVVVSAVVSLTLTPMMCGRLLRATSHVRPGALARGAERVVDRLAGLYALSLEWVLRRQGLTLLVALATLVATVWLYIIVPKGFLPNQDTGLITAVTETAQDVSFDAMRQRQEQVVAALRRDPDVTGVVSLVGPGSTNLTPNTGHLAITLTSPDSRSSSITQVVARLEQAVAGVPGMSVYFQPVQDVQISTRTSLAQYQYTLVDTDSAELHDWSNRLVAALQKVPALAHVTSDLMTGGLQAMVKVDRERAGRLGVAMQSVDDTLYDAFGQRQVSTIYGQANQYRVILEADPRFRLTPASLSSLYVPTSSGGQVPLTAIATVTRQTAPLAVNHSAQFPAVTISFDLAPGAALGTAVSAITATQQAIGMPASIVGSYAGDAAEFSSSLAGEPWLILAAVVVIYIVLGVLYESAIHPLTILSTLPSAGVGALLALILFNMNLSIVALIGIVLLMGIVKKNAIMMIDFALEAERRDSLGPRESIVRACHLRFRPIMMTTLAALLGAVPLAFQHGAGAELRVPLGITIIGGLLLSQFLTLYTTPVIYLAMERLKRRRRADAPDAGPDAGAAEVSR